MTTEIKLRPGWLLRDVRIAAARLDPSQRESKLLVGGLLTAETKDMDARLNAIEERLALLERWWRNEGIE